MISRRLLACAVAGFSLAFSGVFAPRAAGEVAPSSAPASSHPLIVLASIKGSIDPGSSDYLHSAIERAKRDRAEALIVELDTPGGLVSSTREMIQAIEGSTVPVVVFVYPGGASATSAGALLMLGSHVAAMAPGTNIGAAHPVGSGGEDIQGVMGEKALSDTMAFARGLADLRGRNKELADLIVSKSRSFTAEEARQNHLIELISASPEDLAIALNGRSVKIGKETRRLHTEGYAFARQELTIGQSVLHTLANPNISGILMTLGMLLIYVELSHPGLVVPGVAGAICLLTGFVTVQLLPVRTGALLLLVAGLLMLVLEPFVTSYGALAVGGIISFILGMIWLIDPSSTSLTISPMVYVSAAVALGGIVVMVALALRRLNRLSAEALARIGGAGAAGLAGYRGVVELAAPREAEGQAGQGTRGKALFRGEVWNFESDERLERGDAIEAIAANGFVVQVRKIR